MSELEDARAALAETEAFYLGNPPRELRSLPYRYVTRPVTKEVSFMDPDRTFTHYEKSTIGLSCRLGLHRPLEVVIDYWIVFRLGRRLECPCGKAAKIEVY